MARPPNPWEFVPAICALLSFGLCCWLVLFMRRLQPKDRSGLLMRQLWYIAVADMSSAVFSVAMFILDKVPYWTTRWGCAASQYAVCGPCMLGIDMSLLVQAHFTMGLLMSLRRWRRGLACLSRLLPALLLPALILAALDLWTTASVFEFDPALGCVWVTRDDVRRRSAPFTATAALAVVFLNVAAYGLLLLEECSCVRCARSVVLPGSIGVRVLRQAQRYMLVTLCTWLPYWLVDYFGGTGTLTWASNPEQAFSAAGVTLNGALNVWTFALHNRLVRRALARSADELTSTVEAETADVGCPESRHVGIDVHLQICHLSHHGSTSDSFRSALSDLASSVGGAQRHERLSFADEDNLGFLFGWRSGRAVERTAEPESVSCSPTEGQ